MASDWERSYEQRKLQKQLEKERRAEAYSNLTREQRREMAKKRKARNKTKDSRLSPTKKPGTMAKSKTAAKKKKAPSLLSKAKRVAKTAAKKAPGAAFKAWGAYDVAQGRIPYLDDAADIYSAARGTPEQDDKYQERKARVRKSRKKAATAKRKKMTSGNRARQFAKGGLVTTGKPRSKARGCGCATQGTKFNK